MLIFPVKTGIVRPPRDDLLAHIREAKFALCEHDIVAVTSKVVSIWQGRCILIADVPDKDVLIKREAERFIERRHVPGQRAILTLKQNTLIASAGIDASNADGHYVLWPEKPQETARFLLAWFKKEYHLRKLGCIITDSRSTPLRRGAIGFALAWAGLEPLYDYRRTKDIFGREFMMEQTNIADALAAAAVLVMGEGKEQTPIAVIRNAPHVKPGEKRKSPDAFHVPPSEDLFAPLIQKGPWRKGGGA